MTEDFAPVAPLTHICFFDPRGLEQGTANPLNNQMGEKAGDGGESADAGTPPGSPPASIGSFLTDRANKEGHLRTISYPKRALSPKSTAETNTVDVSLVPGHMHKPWEVRKCSSDTELFLENLDRRVAATRHEVNPPRPCLKPKKSGSSSPDIILCRRSVSFSSENSMMRIGSRKDLSDEDLHCIYWSSGEQRTFVQNELHRRALKGISSIHALAEEAADTADDKEDDFALEF
eukprot:CAMPEP_0172600786 /NCGR_PEP_ID=MMETSP1068-20121228/20950_1 /TAXON_ID=35684 /ORGANISM="Pseudopedinella elastica, Strain CCMP716" /LENGTH=232 /DNA_ID=CAMNT_0013401559 /DNA_START=63 /DNA_END=761 /DNA_ORIENTATION=+